MKGTMTGPAGGPLEERIAAIAARQHGVVTRAQLADLGLTPGAMDNRVRSGRLRVLHRGVYLLGPLVGALRPRWCGEMAAVIACGPGAVASHESAARVWGLIPSPTPTSPVHVTVPGRHVRRPGIWTHRVAAFPTGDTAVAEAVPVTAPARTLLDLAARLRPRDLERALARAERLDLTDAAEVAERLARLGPRPGVHLVRAVVAGGSPRLTRSDAEERFLMLTRQARLPEPRTNVPVAGYELDFFWQGEGVAVEVDGFAYHSSRHRFEGDRRRDAELAARGIQVVRVTWRQLVDEPWAVLAAIARTLAVAGARAGRSRD